MTCVRRKIGVVLMSLAMLVTIVGPAAGCARGTPTPEPVTISFAFPRFDGEYYQKMVARFNEEYPYITVELRPKKWDTLGGLGSGDVDVFLTSQFALSWLREQGNILDLTPFIEQDESFNADDFYPGTLALYTREGKRWAVPAGVDMVVMYYNRDLFDQYGVAYPQPGWTWDDFENILTTLHDQDAHVYGYAPNYQLFDPLLFIYQHGGRIFDDLQNPTRTTFDDPLNVEALDWYFGLMYDYGLIPTQEDMSKAYGARHGLQAGVILGKIGMWTGLLSERGGRLWPSKWKMRWGMVPLPRDKRAATLSLVEGYFISAKAQHPDACWKWISFLSHQIPERTAPVRKSLAESSEYQRLVGDETAAVVRASLDNVLLLSPKLAEFEDAFNIFGKAMEAILSGRSTPLEALTWAQQQSKFK